MPTPIAPVALSVHHGVSCLPPSLVLVLASLEQVFQIGKGLCCSAIHGGFASIDRARLTGRIGFQFARVLIVVAIKAE